MDLDGIDKRILQVLSNNSRLSYREIARKLGISHVNVSNRVKRLEENKIIKGYSIVLNLERLNLYTLCLQISTRPGVDLSIIGQEIGKFDQVLIVLRVSGERDLFILAMCKNRLGALDLISKISSIQGIEKVESHVVLEIIKMAEKAIF